MSSQPSQDFALGYTVAQRNLDNKLAEFQNVQRSAEMQQQFVQDSVTAANRHIASGGLPSEVSRDRIQDRQQFTAGMQRGVEEWAQAHQQQIQREQAVVAQQAQETDQGQRRQQQQHRSNDLGISI
jgi:hypothetical protein